MVEKEKKNSKKELKDSDEMTEEVKDSSNAIEGTKEKKVEASDKVEDDEAKEKDTGKLKDDNASESVKGDKAKDFKGEKSGDPKKEKAKGGVIDVAAIAAEIKAEQIREQREPVAGIEGDKKVEKHDGDFVVTGVPGFDDLLTDGIPKGNNILVAGGAGSGKTIFCLQTLYYHASRGKKCLYMSLEENEEKLAKHMREFGWDPEKALKDGTLKIQRINPFDITRNVDALLAKQKGELLIDIDPVIFPKDYEPEFIVIDSLTAIGSAFTGKEENYRIYIEQLFRFLEDSRSTSLLITETEQIPKIFSTTGVEEFLADGVIVMYNIKHGNVRENAIEILKLRGTKHEKKIVAMQITGKGIVVYPDQEVFSEIDTG